MAYMLVRQKVEDWAKWKQVYDGHAAIRKAAGCEGTHVFQNSEDPNEVVILLKWDSFESARHFTYSQERKETMGRAGVLGQPDVCFLNDAGQTSE